MIAYRVVPYDILGVKLYSVESEGYVLKYCDDKEDALSQCEKLNKEYFYDQTTHFEHNENSIPTPTRFTTRVYSNYNTFNVGDGYTRRS